MKPDHDVATEALAYHPSKVAWATAQLVRSPPWIAAHVFVLIVVSILAVAAVYAYVSVVPISIRVTGRLISDHKSYPILSLATVKVTNLPIADGMTVKKGDALFETDQQNSPAVYSRLHADQRQLKAVIQREMVGTCFAACSRELAKLSSDAFAVRVASPLKDSILQLQDLLHDYANAWSNLGQSSGLVTEQRRQIKSAQGKLTIIRNQHADGVMGMEIEGINRDIGAAKSQIADRMAGLRQTLVQARERLNVRLDKFPQEIDDFARSSIYLAPTDGIVTNLTISGPGQTITSGQKLLELMPNDSHIIAEVSVPNREIARIVMDMPAKITLDAFPEREFGDIQANVSTLPSTLADASDPRAPADYLVRLAPKRQFFIKEGQKYAFRLGMTLSAQIVLRRERLLTIGLKRMLNIQDDILNK